MNPNKRENDRRYYHRHRAKIRRKQARHRATFSEERKRRMAEYQHHWYLRKRARKARVLQPGQVVRFNEDGSETMINPDPSESLQQLQTE